MKLLEELDAMRADTRYSRDFIGIQLYGHYPALADRIRKLEAALESVASNHFVPGAVTDRVRRALEDE